MTRSVTFKTRHQNTLTACNTDLKPHSTKLHDYTTTTFINFFQVSSGFSSSIALFCEIYLTVWLNTGFRFAESAISLHNETNLLMGIGHIRSIATVITGKYASSAEITCAFSFLISKIARQSVSEHTHHMNRQVKRSVSGLYWNNPAK